MDAIIESINPFGLYQKLMFIFIGIPSSLTAIAIYSTIFNVAEPNILCKNAVNITFTLKNNTKEFCEIWSNNNSNSYTCYVKDENYGETIISDWNLVCDRKFLAGLTQTLYMLGSFTGLFGGYFGDRYGRKKASFVLLCLLSATMALTQILLLDALKFSITAKYIIYSISQFLIGGFLSCISSSMYVLLMELTTTQYNTLFSNVILSCYVFGELFILLLCYFIRNWRITNFLITGIAIIFTIIFSFQVDESPRWYETQGRNKEAIKVLSKMASTNKRKFEESHFLNEIQKFNKNNTENSSAPVKTNKQVSIKSMLIEIFTPKKVFLKTFMIVYIWFSTTLLYYGITLGINNVDAVNPYLLYIFQALAEIGGYWFCLMNDRFGKRRMNIIYLFVSASVCLIIGFIPINKNLNDEKKDLKNAILIISLISIGKFAISASFNTLYVYTTQLYQTNVRNFTLLFCFSCGRLGSLISPQINLLGGIVWKSLPFLIFSISAFIALIFNFILPEKSI